MMKSILVLLSALFCSITLSGQGAYFSKKTYQGGELPTYADSKHLLPQPVLDKQEWVELYWKAWEIAFSRLQKPPLGSPLVSNWIDEALSPQIFQWDTHFMAMFGRYGHHIFPFINSHDNFYCRQHDDGMICRVINEDNGEDHHWGLGVDNARACNPPLFSWAEIETYKVTGDKSRFALILPVLEKYAEWIDNNRRGNDTPHQLYWNNGQASGMDNTPRDMGRPHPGDGWDQHSAIDHVGWVDMSSQMCIFYKDLAYICNELGHTKKAKTYELKADTISERINTWMWDDKQGLYFDLDPHGVQTKWITVATFWPMFAQISNKEQIEKLVSNLKNPNLFWRKVPVPTLAANQEFYDPSGQYWKGGVWAPTNYMIVQGLIKNNYEDLANDLVEKYLNAISEVYKKTHTLWEVYSPDMYIPATNASGIYMVMPDFVGWTGLAPISMLIENVLGIRLNAPEKKIEWHITQKSSHGLKNIHFLGSTIDLVATRTENGKMILDIESKGQFDLEIYYKQQKQIVKIKNQHTRLEL